MVARGDLGIEIPYEELPIVQRRIVKTCLRVGKPVIVATHMLESMIESPMPTRAEVTDVANAIFEEADAIMLSGETTVGKYPLKCIEVFDRIATRIERSGSAQFHEHCGTDHRAPETREKRRRHGQRTEGRRPFSSFTRTATWRATPPGCARATRRFTRCATTTRSANELTLSWGVTPFVMEFDFINPQNTIETALKILAEQGRLKTGDTVVIIGAIPVGTEIVDAVQMRMV